jgi:four helix bundle protein
VRREKRRHEELDVWRDAMDLVEAVYRMSASFPSDERFGLTAQIRRAVVSVPSNIAEGAARRSRTELLQFLHVARASLAEVETQMQIALRLGMVTSIDNAAETADRVFAKLNAMIRSLQPAKDAEGP